MSIVTCTLALVLGLAVGFGLALRRTYAERALGWRLLAHAGWPLVLAGALFVLRFWTPTSGPYLANERYPFGDYVATWAVSFGFTWIAFGLLFSALAVLAPSADARQSRLVWYVLASTWMLCWLPHGIIAIGVAAGGLAPESVTRYHTWAQRPRGTLVLAADTLLLQLHFGCSVAGFVLAARDAWRTTPRSSDAASPVPAG